MPLHSRSALQYQPSQVRIAAAETESTTMPAPRLSQSAHLHHASGLANPFDNPFQVTCLTPSSSVNGTLLVVQNTCSQTAHLVTLPCS